MEYLCLYYYLRNFFWLRAVVFQLNLKYLHVKITVTMVIQNQQIILLHELRKNGGKISRFHDTVSMFFYCCYYIIIINYVPCMTVLITVFTLKHLHYLQNGIFTTYNTVIANEMLSYFQISIYAHLKLYGNNSTTNKMTVLLQLLIHTKLRNYVPLLTY